MASTDRLPLESGALSAWFAGGVRSELVALEKDGGAQSYEILSGKVVETTGPTQAIFQFIIADGTRIPEDATGKLKTGGDEYTASVVAQQANRVHLHIEGKAPAPPGIPRAMLIIDDTALLRRLAEVLEETAAAPTVVGPLATTVFHPARAKVGSARLPDTNALVLVEGQLRRVLEQACGSSLTYIWGPPGTGKTFGIAHLIAALVENDERVLVTSHTHAAVDQALYAAVNSDTASPGPLAAHPAVSDGKILRIGRTANRKVPDSVRLDKVMELRARELEIAISELEAKAKPLAERRAKYRAAISEWEKLAEFTKRLHAARDTVEEGRAKLIRAEAAISRGTSLLQQRRAELERAQRAWFRREARTERAMRALQAAEGELRRAGQALALTLEEAEKARGLANQIEAALTKQRTVCVGLPARGKLETEAAILAADLVS